MHQLRQPSYCSHRRGPTSRQAITCLAYLSSPQYDTQFLSFRSVPSKAYQLYPKTENLHPGTLINLASFSMVAAKSDSKIKINLNYQINTPTLKSCSTTATSREIVLTHTPTQIYINLYQNVCEHDTLCTCMMTEYQLLITVESQTHNICRVFVCLNFPSETRFTLCTFY
jgi:hypothetical protein